MNFNKKEFDQFRDDMSKIVKPLEEKYGIEISFGRISYTESSFTIKTEITNGSVDELRKNNFIKKAKLYGLKPTDYGKVVSVDGEEHKIIGIEESRRKYPILLVSLKTNKEIVCTINTVQRLLES